MICLSHAMMAAGCLILSFSTPHGTKAQQRRLHRPAAYSTFIGTRWSVSGHLDQTVCQPP